MYIMGMDDENNSEYDHFNRDLSRIQGEVMSRIMDVAGIDIYTLVTNDKIGMHYSETVFKRMKNLGWTQEQIHTYK